MMKIKRANFDARFHAMCQPKNITKHRLMVHRAARPEVPKVTTHRFRHISRRGRKRRWPWPSCPSRCPWQKPGRRSPREGLHRSAGCRRSTCSHFRRGRAGRKTRGVLSRKLGSVRSINTSRRRRSLMFPTNILSLVAYSVQRQASF